MKFVNVRLLVNDMAAAMKFWRDVMELRMTYGDEAMGYAYFETDSAGVELMTRKSFAEALGKAEAAPPQGYLVALVLQVDDVDATYADLVKRSAMAVAGPQDRPAWGVRSAHLSDPDGYIVEIYSKLDRADV